VNVRLPPAIAARLEALPRRTVWGVAGGAMGLVLGAYWLLHKPAAHPADPPAVAVNVATVTRGDVPEYLEGLGTVQAFYTVTVTARVDGRIDNVAFREGQDVKKGALLAQIDPRPYQAALGVASAARDKDRAQLENARRDLERYEELAPEDLASKQTVDTQKALIAQLIAQVKGDEAAIDNARTNLDYTTVTSPIEGRTGIRLVDPGNNVHATDTTGMVVVTQIEPISIIFSLPEENFTQLSAALGRGAVTAVALSRDGKDELDQGTVALIDNQIDQTTGTIRVKATLPNRQRRLWPGEFVNVRVLTQTRRQVLTIPASALQRGPDGLFTYLVRADSTVAVAPVSASEPAGNVVVVDQGLAAGDQVVTSNFYRLQPGTRIRANTAAEGGAPQSLPAPRQAGSGQSGATEPAP
jgi:multidrug efflux system membrane fusion protein